MSHRLDIMRSMTCIDDAIARLAEGQHGVFTRRQAVLQGASRRAAQHRLASGSWDRVAGDVFRIVGAPQSWKQRVAVAVLAGGPPAAASHAAAAALLGVPGFEPGPVESLRQRGSDHRPLIGVLHETRVIPRHHLVVVDGIVATNLPRTLFDLAGRLRRYQVERLVDWALARNPALLPEMHAMLRELGRRGRPGIATMRALLDERGPGYVAPASELERLALRLLREDGLPEPVRQFDAGSATAWIGRVDLAYPEHRVLIEINSNLHHRQRSDVERDEFRYAQLAAAGWRVIPIGSELLRHHPRAFTRLVREALQVRVAA
jgi:hypothetical protein